jgi:hypothetical protein
MEIHMER